MTSTQMAASLAKQPKEAGTASLKSIVVVSSEPAAASPPASGGFEAPRRLSWGSILLILLFGGSLLSVSLGGSTRVLTQHEVVFAQPAREMLASGDWIIPRMLGVPDTHKPPLTTWLIALSMALFGSDGEWVVRLPGVVSAVVCALMVAAMTARWFGDRAGLLAGLMQTTMYYTLMLARLAEVDGILVTTVCAALSVFALANVDSPGGRRSGRWLPWFFYLAVVLTFLAKGLIGLVFIFSGAGLFMLWQRDLKVLWFLLDPVGLLIFTVGTLAWPIAAYCSYPPFLDDQITHHFGRFNGVFGESEPIYAYLYAVPLCTLPWTPFVAVGAWRLARQHADYRSLNRFVMCWIIPGMMLLTASVWRHKHYAAPLLPPLTVMAAVGLIAYSRYRQGRPLRSPPHVAGLVVAGFTLAAGMILFLRPRGHVPIALLTMATGLLAVPIICFEQRGRLRAEAAALFCMVWIVIAGTLTWVIPYHDSYRPQVEFARGISAVLPANATFYLVGLPETQITYYLAPAPIRVDKPKEFLSAMRSAHREMYVVAPQHVLDDLESTAEVRILRCHARTPDPRDQLAFARLDPIAED